MYTPMHKPRPRPLSQASKRYTRPYHITSRTGQYRSRQLYVQTQLAPDPKPKLSHDQVLLAECRWAHCIETVPHYDKFARESRLQYGSRESMIAYCDLLLGLYAGSMAISTVNFSWICDCPHTESVRVRFEVLDQKRVEREREQHGHQYERHERRAILPIVNTLHEIAQYANAGGRRVHDRGNDVEPITNIDFRIYGNHEAVNRITINPDVEIDDDRDLGLGYMPPPPIGNMGWFPHPIPYRPVRTFNHIGHMFRTLAEVDRANQAYAAAVNRLRGNPMPAHQQTIYNDKQNVHTRSIGSSISRSVNNLKTDPKPDFESILDLILGSNLSADTKQRLIQFCDDDTRECSTDLTYSQLLAYVWQRVQHPGTIDSICEDDRRLELERILEQRISDCIDRRGNQACFTGRFSRLVSTLDGFFLDIRIGISDNERITAIVLQTRDKLEPYDTQVHIDIATLALLEAGFRHEQFKAWIDELKAADD